MKRLTASTLTMLLGITLMGCADSKTIALKSQSERTDVFQEISGGDAIPAGYADLTIRANIKTHLEGYYIGESKESAHGKSTYPFIVNIDGQTAQWRVDGKRHELPLYVDGKTSRDPEAGDGMKYVLNKKIRLRAGSHKLFFGLSEDDYYREIVIDVKEGETQMLEFKPQYKHKTLPLRMPTYMKGVSHYDILFNGSPAAQ